MGKSTILYNLSGFLPESVYSVTVSLQDRTAFTSLAYLLETVVRSLPKELAPPSVPADLPAFHRCLETLDVRLKGQGKRLLIAIDEYENLDAKIGAGIFPEDLLAALREWIQAYRHIIWVFAGSHEITELSNAQWTSYLVSAQTIEVPPFTPEETRLLLTHPLKHSPCLAGP